MLSTALTLFLAGLLTILLPCILPLIPIVLGVSVADKQPLKPLVTVLGMLVSFIGCTFLLQVALSQFIELADIIRITTFYVLLLFGLGFLLHQKSSQLIGALIGSVFFLDRGWKAMLIAAVCGFIAVEIGGRVASFLQQAGADVQQKARAGLGAQSLTTAFVIGLTLGLVWAPCAGPALGFALAVVRDKPGLDALLYLTAYGLGAGIPLLIIGYGGQAAVHSVRALTKYTGLLKQIAGVMLILFAIGFRYDLVQDLQTWITTNTGFGTLGNQIEESLFGSAPKNPTVASGGTLSNLPILGKAPTSLPGLGPWHNSEPIDITSLHGKVVLVDFWTYSCINCIRTLPYIQAIWDKYKDQPFVLLGVHTPEFTFEKSEKNVSMAITKHKLTYPIAQDNDFGTWNAFQNHYWPAKYLIDGDGNIRYVHFGEGNYEETSEAVAALLKEMGKTTSNKALPTELPSIAEPITPETYLHSRSWDSFANAAGNPDSNVHAYTFPKTLPLHTFALSGTWQLTDDERQVLKSPEGQIRIHALAGEVNLVLGPEEGTSAVKADITVDGKPAGSLTIDMHDLYTLFKGSYGEHDIVLTLHGAGVGAYAFTFGS